MLLLEELDDSLAVALLVREAALSEVLLLDTVELLEAAVLFEVVLFDDTGAGTSTGST